MRFSLYTEMFLTIESFESTVALLNKSSDPYPIILVEELVHSKTAEAEAFS